MLQSIDNTVFRFINHSLSNPVFDWLMPQLSESKYFFPLLIGVLILLLWKGGRRGRIYVVMVLLAVIIGDSVICNSLKQLFQRPRPYEILSDARLLLGRGGSGSMPSSHAANWFAATMVTLIFYRRSWSWLFILFVACAVSFSRLYNGVHFPTDILAGAILGAAYGAAIVIAVDWLWRKAGELWFYHWWRRLPSLINVPDKFLTPKTDAKPIALPSPTKEEDEKYWLRLGYAVTLVLFILRLVYISAPIIELSEDEAYQWTWSKHLALSYYSKPPLIALVQFLGTHLWGDRESGVRFFSPLISALISLLLLRFFSRQGLARVGLALVLMFTATPLMAVGSTLMTIDPISVLFWTAAMMAGWRAVQPEGTTRDWLWVGLWMGLGFLSKYTNLFQWLCWIIFFCAYPPARKQLRTPGPYLALGINALCSIPVLIWNAQHNWITIQHVANDGAIGNGWHSKFLDFVVQEFLLLNPLLFVAMIVAVIAFFRSRPDPFGIFLFCMGAPLFLFYLLFSLHSRVLPNWIAPSILPLFCLSALYWRDRWSERWFRRVFGTAITLGIVINVFTHDTNLIGKISSRPLPAKIDPLRRVRAWSATATKINQVRHVAESQPSFIICDHYGMTGELSFYVPEAQKVVGTDKPLVYFMAQPHPENQFFFWPNYLSRTGESAIFVQSLEEPKLVEGSFRKWLRGNSNLGRPDLPLPRPAPALIQKQFTSVKDLGIFKVEYRGRLFRHFQLFECRGLLPSDGHRAEKKF